MIYYLILCVAAISYQVMARPSRELRAAGQSSNKDHHAILRMCRRQLSHGAPHCKAMTKRWHYDSSSQTCKPFEWTGCGGNDNRFESREECESQCQNVPPCRPHRIRPGPENCTAYKAIGISDGCPAYHWDCQDLPSVGPCEPAIDIVLPKDCRTTVIRTAAGCEKEIITCSSRNF